MSNKLSSNHGINCIWILNTITNTLNYLSLSGISLIKGLYIQVEKWIPFAVLAWPPIILACRTSIIFLRILYANRGESDASGRAGKEITPVRIPLFEIFSRQTHPKWPANHSVKRTVVIMTCRGPKSAIFQGLVFISKWKRKTNTECSNLPG